MMNRGTLLRTLAFGLVAVISTAMPMVKADPPKATLILINATTHDVVVEFDSASTKAWMRVPLRPGVEHIAYEIVGAFRLVGTVKSNPPANLMSRDVVLSKNGYQRLRIEHVDGRYVFVKP
jgi:hypothetical protein